MRPKLILLVCFFVSMLAFNALAAIDITNRTGTISIAMPGGTVVTLTMDQQLPAVIPDGAVITVVSGTANISTSGASTVSVLIGGSKVQVSAGTTLILGLDPKGVANVTVVTGQAIVSNGKTSATLGVNSSVSVTLDANTGAGSFQVVSGSVVFQLPDGTTVTRDPSNPTVEFKAEAYTPPELPDVTNVRNDVAGDETSRDISPSK